MKATLLLALAACSCNAAPWNAPRQLEGLERYRNSVSGLRAGASDAPWANYSQSVHWYKYQLLDHFSSDTRTWAQRYFVVNTFARGDAPPVILHVAGEYTSQGVMPARLWPLKLAYDWGAVVVTVEHRFFGESQPLDNLSTENLAFHTSRQAIKDLARFTGWFQASEMGGKSGPWITIGGSYPGALTAWYRTLEPQATIAAHSASGVIHAITNFTAFDEQVGRSVGPQCAAALRATTAALEAGAASGRDVRAQFGAQALSWGDFWYFMADAAAETVQYGHHEAVCSALVPAHRNGSDLVDAFAGFVQSFVVGVMGDSAADYDTSAMASGAQTHNNGRSWWWQKCNEFGWFQVAPEHGSIRSSAVDYTYHMEVCRALFGKTTPPDVAGTNEYYGGLAINGTQIFLSNGGEDPWQWAGLPPVQKDERVSNLVSCDDCAHCVDLYTPTDADADALQTDRLTSQKLLESWAGLHTQQNPLPQVAVQ